MGRGTWDLIKGSKQFHVLIYRRVGSILVFSLSLNVMLCVLLPYTYFTRPDYKFYSTDGATPPMRLTPMSSPNDSSVPILPSYPPREEEQKELIE